MIEAPCYLDVKVSSDGSRAFFFSADHLTADDTDGRLDLYERSGGTTTRLSTGPSGGNGNFSALNRGNGSGYGVPLLVSDDGDHAFFMTNEPLVSTDTDTKWDVYERTAGTTRLVSTDPADTGATDSYLLGIARDGSPAFVWMPTGKIYERAGGVTSLISTGPTDRGNSSSYYIGLSRDERHVFFYTWDQLVSADTDFRPDIYMRSVGYATPASAQSLSASLVPTFKPCGTGGNPINSKHAPPLATDSCSPPLPGSAVAVFGAQAVGSAAFTATPGDPDTAPDEADVSVAASLSDIQTPGGSDYNPNAGGADLTLIARLRMTDAGNCTPSPCSGAYTDAATASDTDYTIPVDCAGTSDPGIGASCSVNTTLDTITPGLIVERKETVLQTFRIRSTIPGPTASPTTPTTGSSRRRGSLHRDSQGSHNFAGKPPRLSARARSLRRRRRLDSQPHRAGVDGSVERHQQPGLRLLRLLPFAGRGPHSLRHQGVAGSPGHR